MNALILAGSRGLEAFALNAGVSHKVLLPIAEEAMIFHVVRTLLNTPQVTKIYIAIEEERFLKQVPALAALLRARRINWIPTAESPAASIVKAITMIGMDEPLLITTGDHPLLTTEMIDVFLANVPKDCAFAAALAPADIITAQYPGAIRTFYRLGKERFSGCNLFYAQSEEAAKIADYWRRLESFRKRPLRLIFEIGAFVLARAILGKIDLESACHILSRKMGANVCAVRLPFTEAAIDVDKLDDWKLVENILKQRAIVQ